MLEICRRCWTCSMRDETMGRGSKDAILAEKGVHLG